MDQSCLEGQSCDGYGGEDPGGGYFYNAPGAGTAWGLGHTFTDYHYGDSGETVSVNGLGEVTSRVEGDFGYTPPAGATTVSPGGQLLDARNPIFAFSSDFVSPTMQQFNTASNGGGLTFQYLNKDTALNILKDYADGAYNAVPDLAPQPLRGYLIHQIFEYAVESLGSPFFAEQTYLLGGIATYGTPGSSRVDGGYGPLVSPIVVVDLKTGATDMSAYQITKYNINLPAGTPAYMFYWR